MGLPTVSVLSLGAALEQAFVDEGDVSGAKTVDLRFGNARRVRMTGNVTFSFSGATSGKSCSLTLMLVQDGTGGRLATWPGSVVWDGGAPTLRTGAASVDFITFITFDGGTTWYGFLIGAAPGTMLAGPASGPPTSGTYSVRDVAVDADGTMWVCVTAGTPGTWAAIAGTEIAYAEITSSQTFTTQADVTGASIVVPSGLARPVYLEAGGLASNDTNLGGCVVLITNSSNVNQRTMRIKSAVAADAHNMFAKKKLPAGTGGTYKLRAQRVGAVGTATVFADATDVFFLRAVMA